MADLRDPRDRGRPETREGPVALRPASRSLSVQDVTQSSINSASVSSSIFSLHRDVKGVSDAQARLVRVIEDVSQELHQRLSQHDQQLDQLSEKQETLQETFLQVQKEEKAWRQSLDAEYLRLRTLDGNFQTQMNYVESKLGQLEKCLTDRGRSNWSLDSQGQGRMQRQMEEFRGNLDTLEARLSGALSQQLQSQLLEIVQQQLQQVVQPQLQQQLQQQLKDVHVLDVQRLCEEQVKQLEQRLWSGQETLRKEALKREQHLAELQDAAQRLAQTAMQRAQASTEAHAQVFSASSSLNQRLQLVEKELQSLQRHEKERHKRRILRLEEDLAGAEETASAAALPSSAVVSPGSAKRELPEASADLLRIDELRVQLYTELSDARHVTTQLSGRVARCEAEILDLRQVMNAAAMEDGPPRRSPATPDWPSPWQVASRTEEPLQRVPGVPGNALPALPSPPSPAPAPPMGIDAAGPCPSSHSRLLQGMPEGPQLSSSRDTKDSSVPAQESPPRSSGRFGVLPPPKVTPAVEPATL
ncbi:unnamed protein product [Cladocopium goreaui]|uniref:Ubiquitin-like domain-containing protein n=1 Tax=Cladocopium goreaui TaxID=2562237 RepID=A0A9P1DBQ7_9DINO|nr:unnamed protein product [Cladocopium goreaui]